MSSSDDTERLLWLLEHGTQQERIVARTQLGTIFAQRGQWEYAAECIELNISDGVDLARMYRTLAGIRVIQGREDEASALLEESHRHAGAGEATELAALLRKRGRVKCAGCGHWNATNRASCSNCRRPFGPPLGSLVVGASLLVLLLLTWPYLGWGSMILALGVWFVFGLVLRALGLYPR